MHKKLRGGGHYDIWVFSITYLTGDMKGRSKNITNIISAYKKPAINVHCKLIITIHTKTQNRRLS